MSVWRWALMLLAVGLGGCAGHGRVPRIGEPPPTARDETEEKRWQEVVGKYSDVAQIYDGLDTRLFVAASWQAPHFVEARVGRMAAFQAVPQGELPSLLDAERQRMSDASEIFLGVHSNEAKHDDFDRANSIWRITLSACSTDYAAREIVRVGRASLNLRSIYPYMDTFWVAYRVRFPKLEPCTEERVSVRIASALGLARLEFPRE